MIAVSEVKHSINILEVVSYVVKLRQSGRGYVGLCPFHPDKSPSFCVNPDLGRWHCFSEGRGGDVIDFVMESYHLSFKDALKYLGVEQAASPVKVQAQIEAQKRKAELLRRYREWGNEKLDNIAVTLRNVRRLLGEIKTEDDLDRYGDLFHLLPWLEFENDLLIHGTEKEKFNYYQGELSWALL